MTCPNKIIYAAHETWSGLLKNITEISFVYIEIQTRVICILKFSLIRCIRNTTVYSYIMLAPIQHLYVYLPI